MRNKKRIVIITGLILILLVICVVIYLVFSNSNHINTITDDSLVKVLEDGTKVATSSKLLETKEIDGLQITEITLKENNNITQLLGKVTNNSEEEKGDYIITITFINKEGNEMTSIKPYIKKLQPGESTNLNASITFDYTNAYDIAIKK